MFSFTRSLIAANVVVFLLQAALGDALVNRFALWPPLAGDWIHSSLGSPWQALSYSFLHGGVMHLALNMFGLWMFGGPLEQAWGARRLALAYFASVFFGAVVQLGVALAIGTGGAPVVGASAGVFGLMLAYALVFPESRILLLFLPVPLPARVFVLLYAVIELTLGVTGTQAGVAHFAHLGGLVGGALVVLFSRGRSRVRR